MKIFVHVTASAINQFVGNPELFPAGISYNRAISDILSYGSTSMLGIEREKLNSAYFVTFANSSRLQQKWAQENNIQYSDTNWEIEILSQQIEYFAPDVIYTVNPSWLSRNFTKLPSVKLKVAWRAAPIGKNEDFSDFDVGLSYAPFYLDLLQQHGVKNVEQMDFYFDPRIRTRLDRLNLQKENDICFVGRYGPMFAQRNQLLKKAYKRFHKTRKIAYHLLVVRRIKGLVPMIPLGMLWAYRKPVFLNDLLEVFVKSKIVLNRHSDISAQYKGNMRVFEALGTGSFMLSDAGVYPEHLVDGRDFVGYTSEEDLLNKIEYYLAHDEEREAIAQQGCETLSQYYSTERGSQKLQNIFAKYL